jgi:predicted RNase H-like HicB family nuclease
MIGTRMTKTRQKSAQLNYEIVLYWSNEDGVFIAEVPELPGCIAHGDSQESALASVKEAMQLWIDTAKEFGDPIPVPKGRRLMLA